MAVFDGSSVNPPLNTPSFSDRCHSAWTRGVSISLTQRADDLLELAQLSEAPDDSEGRLVFDERPTFTARVDPRTRIRPGKCTRGKYTPSRRRVGASTCASPSAEGPNPDRRPQARARC